MSAVHFSIVIPAYNAAATLRSTVTSVQAQTDQDFEIIIIDDGSTDETLSIMLDLAAADVRIRAISKPNTGVSDTRNLAGKLAKGKLLAFLDADDQWHPAKLARHRVAHAFDPLLTASFAQVEFAPERGAEMAKARTFSTFRAGCLDLADVLVENAICTTSNLVVKRDVFHDLGGFDPTMRFAEDQELLARIIADGGMILGIEEPLVRYRMSADGLSCDFEAMLSHWRRFASYWIEGSALAQAEATYCRYLTRRALRAGARMEVARSFARRGLKADRAAFMAGGTRSFLTLGGAIAGGALPASLRRAVFA